MTRFFRTPAAFLTLVLAIATIGTARSSALADANSQEGCMNQWLFNGAWRVKVTKVDPYMNGGQQTGWQVTEVWRNGTTQEVSPTQSELQDQKLTLSTGSISASASSSGLASMGSLANQGFAPAAQFTHLQVFVAQNFDPSNKPQAVDIVFDEAKLAMYKAEGARGVHAYFTTSKYNYHFKLNCVATGAAPAQGGAFQVAATQGCMNQWMSNGVWKMRATAIAPDNNDPTSPQIGWMISEQWANVTTRPLAPNDTLDTDQYLVTEGGDDIPASNSTVTALTKQQLDFHTFPAGGSFTYQQRFRWTEFSAADKPTKLLVTFDAAQENKNPNRPHYKLPANFRVNLECTK